jgi:hypothetical protein
MPVTAGRAARALGSAAKPVDIAATIPGGASRWRAVCRRRPHPARPEGANDAGLLFVDLVRSRNPRLHAFAAHDRSAALADSNGPRRARGFREPGSRSAITRDSSGQRHDCASSADRVSAGRANRGRGSGLRETGSRRSAARGAEAWRGGASGRRSATESHPFQAPVEAECTMGS